MASPVTNVALIGGGIFARQSHVPALNKLSSKGRVCVKAVYSRSQESATQTKALLQPNEHIKVYWGDDYSKILEDPDIKAVLVVTPIETLPGLVLQSLKAGKHVLSEKPVSPTVKIGQELIDEYQKNHSGLVWGVAENYYFEPAFRSASKLVTSGTIGTPTLVNVSFSTTMNADSPYFHTKWRQTPGYQGGYVLDAGVHLISAVRMALGDVTSVTGISKLFKPELPPIDTLSASFVLSSGCVGSLAMTFASSKISSPFAEFAPPLFAIYGDKGTINVYRDKLDVITSGKEGLQVLKPTIVRDTSTALVAEIANFLDCVDAKLVSNDSEGFSKVYKPQEALKDVQFFESILQPH